MIDHIINIALPVLVGFLITYIIDLRNRNEMLRQSIELLRKELGEELRRRDDNV